MKFKKLFYIVFFICTKICLHSYFSLFDKVQSAPTLNFSSSIKYSLIKLPIGYGPNNNTNISVLQFPGLKFCYCNLSQTSIPNNDISLSVIFKNRFGSRFSNSEISQLYISLAYIIVKNDLENHWQSYISSQTSNAIETLITTSTSGICAFITLPYNESEKGVDILSQFCSLLINFNLSKTSIDIAFTNAEHYLQNSVTRTRSNNTMSTSSIEQIKNAILHPKMDASVEYGIKTYEGGPGSITGSVYTRASYLVQLYKNTIRAYNQINYLFRLHKYERSFLIFAASANIIIEPKILDLAINFYKKTLPNTSRFLTEMPVCGDSITKGISNIFNETVSYGESGFGIIIISGKINLKSMLAAAMIAKLTNGDFISPLSNGTSVNIIPFAGTIQVRIAGGKNTNVIQNTTNILQTYLNSLSSRYINSSNDSDFTTHILIIDELLNHFTPGLYSSKANFTSEGIAQIYNSTTKEYVIWMELFYGAFKVTKELRDLSLKTSQEKIETLKQACYELINQSNINSNNTSYYEIN